MCVIIVIFSGIAAGIYTTNSPDACLHCLQVSRANICVVEDDIQLQKILSIRDQLPKLKAIVQYTGEPKDSSVYSVSLIKHANNNLLLITI